MLRLTIAAFAAGLLLAGCGALPSKEAAPGPVPAAPPATHPKVDPDLPVLPAAGSGRGAYYLDDGPGDNPPPGLRDVPDAVVKAEPLAKFANRPYVVLGKTYTPLLADAPFSQRGLATWYGKKFHGQRTSSGELYDMYKMTAAHPTLPIPSYARITSVVSGKQVVVRINDRGPFSGGRIVDVSYTAALKLGLLGNGSQEVELVRVLPGEALRTETAKAGDEPLTPAPEGYYLQLGAFSSADKAAAVRKRVLGAGVVEQVEVVLSGAMHRLYGGPFSSRAAALKAARALPASLAIKPLVVRLGAD
jgi:rare lipoprotein A